MRFPEKGCKYFIWICFFSVQAQKMPYASFVLKCVDGGGGGGGGGEWLFTVPSMGITNNVKLHNIRLVLNK